MRDCLLSHTFAVKVDEKSTSCSLSHPRKAATTKDIINIFYLLSNNDIFFSDTIPKQQSKKQLYYQVKIEDFIQGQQMDFDQQCKMS